jgi:hypothetical protein
MTDDQEVEFSRLNDKFEKHNEMKSARRKLRIMCKFESLKPIEAKTEAAPDTASSM